MSWLNHFDHKLIFAGALKLDNRGVYLGPVPKFFAQQLQHNALLGPTAHIDYVRDTRGTVDAPHVALVHPVINQKTDLSNPSLQLDPNIRLLIRKLT